MPENKTKVNTASVAGFLSLIDDETRRADAKALLKLMETASGQKAVMWGPAIVGFGSHHYKYESGREGDMPLIAFSPRKAALVLYGMHGAPDAEALLAKLGKCESGKGCVYIKKIADVDQKALGALLKKAWVAAKAKPGAC